MRGPKYPSENYIKIVKKITVNICSQRSSHEISDDIFWQPTSVKSIQNFLIDYPPVLAQTNFPNSWIFSKAWRRPMIHDWHTIFFFYTRSCFVYIIYIRSIVLITVVVIPTFRLLCPPAFLMCIAIWITYKELWTKPFKLSLSISSGTKTVCPRRLNKIH